MGYGYSLPHTWRCSRCAHDWPDHTDYRTCPQCGEKTSRCQASPMSMEDAVRLKANLEFERFYEKRGPKEPYGDVAERGLDAIATAEAINELAGIPVLEEEPECSA